MQLLPHQFHKAFVLLGRELFAQFLLHVFVFIVNVRRDLIPKVADAFLGVANNFFEVRVLLGGEVKVFLDATHQFNFAQLFQRKGLLPWAWSIVRSRCGRSFGSVGNTLNHVAGDEAGGENHERREDGFPGVHQAESLLS